MVSELFTNLTTGGSAFVTFLKSMLETVISIFWEAGSGSTAGHFSDVGILMLIGMSVGLVYGIIRWISKLVRLKG